MTRTDAATSTLDARLARSLAAAAAMRRSTIAERAAWLEAGAEALDAHAAELVALAGEESHLPAARLTGELARTTNQLRLFAAVIREGSWLELTIDHDDPSTVPPTPDLRRMLVPLGPVAVFAASNFPFAFSVAGGDTASALAAGNPVVVKVHPGHPRLSERVATVLGDALVAAGAPEGVLETAAGREEGIALVQHPAITAVGFTGSIPGGRALFDLAASRPDPIPFYGELGSLNPVVITAAAIAARGQALAEGLVGSFTLGAGQFCTKPGVVLVPAGSGFAEQVASGAQAVATQPMLMPRIAEGFETIAARLAAVEGVRTLSPALPSAVEQGGATPLVLAAPARTVLAAPDALLEECFGPAVLLVEYADEAELHAVLRALPGGLTATLHAEESDEVDATLALLEAVAGRVLFAGWPTGVAVSWAQHHGGPWPATTSLFTSVGASALRRWLRPVAYQQAPESRLPLELREANPLGLPRRVDGVLRTA
ncbi:aldehyde dehydrogenase (NADP(+)) [Microcella daejeonensis]|uniref:Aldehyde dehydrogenase (NADP(+)) n=1 Tax=Microcella daejeonensis TaxID=2994971 RepID=A0A9E8MP21_9MICO|nr:aldehyde dehydrogenase (NADP(+)) [Microcella daejeonensis]WAB82472.1 aldehyde dehydrogenase (NADP(+)) [Microcella daejeonensis]